jgi:aldehyde:ferredoxin oxidoreductase
VNPDAVPFKAAMKIGITEPTGATELSERKARTWYTAERWNNMEKVVGLCFFGPAPRSFIQSEDVVGAIRAASGWDVTVDELLEVGERAINLARVFNVREGFTRADDRLPDRLHSPLENGPLEGTSIPRDAFDATLTELYRLKGWDPETAVPTPERLRALGIEWTADKPAGSTGPARLVDPA